MRKIRFYSFITIALLSILASACASQNDGQAAQNPASGASAAETIAKADTLFRERTDVAKLRDAVNLLAQIRNQGSRNFETEWKFSEYNYFLGKQTDDEKESGKAFEAGVQAGRIAARLAPDKPDGYFWSGANLGEQAKRSPLTKGLSAVGDIRDAMNKVIEIEPGYQAGSAFDALAQIELATGLTGGKTEKAIENLEQALRIDKNNSNVHLHLAEAYLKANRNADAKRQLEYVVQMKPDPNFLPEYKENNEAAKKLLDAKF